MNYSARYHVFNATFQVISRKVDYLWDREIYIFLSEKIVFCYLIINFSFRKIALCYPIINFSVQYFQFVVTFLQLFKYILGAAKFRMIPVKNGFIRLHNYVSTYTVFLSVPFATRIIYVSESDDYIEYFFYPTMKRTNQNNCIRII